MEIINDVYEELETIKKNLGKNRFFVEEGFLKRLKDIFEENEILIDKGAIFYCTREYPRKDIDSHKSGTQFEGFDKKESFVNEAGKWKYSGRMD